MSSAWLLVAEKQSNLQTGKSSLRWIVANSEPMCWDVTIARFPCEILTMAELPDSFRPSAIATRPEVAQSLKRLFPEADISDLSWIVLDRDEYKIEINTGHHEPCGRLRLHVRGSSKAISAVAQIARNFDARAFDMTACQFLDRMSNPASGFDQWRKYSRRVVLAPQAASR
jgi:hypothetical protein